MKSIIGKCLNAESVGIGNSASEPELDVLAPGIQGDLSGLEDVEALAVSENDNEDDDDEGQGGDQCRTQNKRSATTAGLDEDVKPKPRTPARANTSKPTPAGQKPKKMKGLEDLTEIAVAEEVTRQKELDLDIERSKNKATAVQAKAEVQKAAIEAKREKVKQPHEMEMMKLQIELAKTRQPVPGIGLSVPMQHRQGSVHPLSHYPSLSPSFDFGDSGQFVGTTGENEGPSQGGFE
jgi:hypothetical protein